MPEFSLRALLRQVARDLGTGDKHAIAKEALFRIPLHNWEEALLQALTETARAMTGQAHPAIAPAPAGQAMPVQQRSAKLAAIRKAWPQLRATYSCLDPGKAFGDYTADDLRFVAIQLDKQAAANSAKAIRFRQIGDLLAAHNAARVRELPEPVLAALFTRKKA